MVRPWLTAESGRLTRRYVVVPTRGQSHALKQRCLAEGVALLGVEFLSPGLARQKWLALARPAQPAPGHELLLLGLLQLAGYQEESTEITPGFGKFRLKSQECSIGLGRFFPPAFTIQSMSILEELCWICCHSPSSVSPMSSSMASQRFSACRSMTIGFGPKKSFKSMILSVRESSDTSACGQYG